MRGDEVGRYRIYRTKAALAREVEGYFRSISRTETVTEPVWTGELDRYGHKIMEPRPVLNDDGEEIRVRVFHVPPTRGGLCAFLGISNSTWLRYCDPVENPAFAEVTEWAEDQLLNWRSSQLHIRPDKQIKGLLYDLSANYRVSEKKIVELTPNQDLRELTDEELRALLAMEEVRGG